MLFLRVCFYFILISILGFGSGSVFLLYSYNYFVDTGIITIEQFKYYLSIAEMLPAATSVKILTLISYDLFGLIATIISITIFMIPTVLVCYGVTKLINNAKYIKFLNLLGVLFIPVLGALICFLAIKVISISVSNFNQLLLVFFLTVFTYVMQNKYIKNTTIMIFINIMIVIFIAYIP